MLFSSLLFLYLFLPVTLFFVFISKEKLSNLVLLIASIIFCAWGGVSYTSVLIISIVINYTFGILIGNNSDGKIRKICFISGIVLNILLLLIFKYTNFFLANLNHLLPVSLPMKKILLPLGISFYTFKAITYLISVYHGEIPADKNFINVALFISLFPQLAAGPIDRFRELQPQIVQRQISFGNFAIGIRRFGLGFAKKVIISTPLAFAADQVFALPQNTLDTVIAWLGIICYSLQIYFDFSGYTDMAIGVGRMFGFTFRENFNFPYLSKSVKEFWSRWHMSLSLWFRDYLFLPLAYSFSRKLKKESYLKVDANWMIYAIATMITFVLCGFWHGAAWTFVIWGGLHGMFLCIERTSAGKLLRKSPAVLQHVYFLFFIIISWVFFRISSQAEAFRFLGILFGGGVSTNWVRLYDLLNAELIIAFALAVFFSTSLTSRFVRFMSGLSQRSPMISGRGLYHVIRISEVAAILLVLLTGTIILASGTTNAFLYFKF